MVDNEIDSEVINVFRLLNSGDSDELEIQQMNLLLEKIDKLSTQQSSLQSNIYNQDSSKLLSVTLGSRDLTLTTPIPIAKPINDPKNIKKINRDVRLVKKDSSNRSPVLTRRTSEEVQSIVAEKPKEENRREELTICPNKKKTMNLNEFSDFYNDIHCLINQSITKPY
jgi:hypothetical protein